MIPTIWNSITQSLARIIPALKMNARKTVAESVVHRRIVVTVERESVSTWVRGQSVGGGESVTTVNSCLDRGLSSRPGPEVEPTTTAAVTPATRLGADPKFPKGGG
jgi:hypothetical protein